LTASDPLCDTGNEAFEAPGEFSNPETLFPLGIPNDATQGGRPLPAHHAVTITAAPDGGGTPVTLTDTVTANFN
jgi:hypothetical protein